jgi:hypothetical protein
VTVLHIRAEAFEDARAGLARGAFGAEEVLDAHRYTAHRRRVALEPGIGGLAGRIAISGVLWTKALSAPAAAMAFRQASVSSAP